MVFSIQEPCMEKDLETFSSLSLSVLFTFELHPTTVLWVKRFDEEELTVNLVE